MAKSLKKDTDKIKRLEDYIDYLHAVIEEQDEEARMMKLHITLLKEVKQILHLKKF